MNTFPLELIENIFYFLDGASFSRLSRVNLTWCLAKQNVEKNHSIWRRLCAREIDPEIIDEINGMKGEKIEQISEDNCKMIYKKWYRTRQIAQCKVKQIPFEEEFDFYEEIRVIKSTGQLNCCSFKIISLFIFR